MAIRRTIESWLSWLPWYRRAARDADLARELRDHLAFEAEEQRAAGLSPQEAGYAAHRVLGNTLQIEEDVRVAWGLHWLETLAQDVRYGLRQLHRSPGFTAVAVLTLALGIGANTAIFSLVDWMILRPLPIARPSQVVFLGKTWKNGNFDNSFSYPDVQRIQQQTLGVFSAVSAYQMFQMDGLTVGATSQPMFSVYVDGNFFRLLGIKAALGRLILPSEGQVPGADPVLVIGYAYWKTRFAGDPGIIGKEALVNGRPVTIVGVAPKDFHGVTAAIDFQGYMPLAMAATMQDASPNVLTDSKDSSFGIIARRQEGVSLRQAQAALDLAARNLSQPNNLPMTVLASPLGPATLVTGGSFSSALNLVSVLFLILAGAVLVLACMNIANLFLVRVAARQREVTMRAALGATRSRLVRQLLTESLLLALLGCLAGIVLGIAASRSLGSIPLRSNIPFVLDFQFDWRVFSYALVAAVLTGALVGLTPALRASRADLNEVLHEGGRTSTGRRQRLRDTLVIAQVAGSLMLLVVAGLFVRSLENVKRSDLGFNPAPVLNVSFDPHQAGYQESQAREFEKTLLERARALPGVASASLAISVPMSYASYSSALNIDGSPTPAGGHNPSAGYNAVSSGYFVTMGIPLLQGRDFLDSDTQSSALVAIVNQNFANRYWHGQNPIGRSFSLKSDPRHQMQVVGMVRNSRDNDMFTSNDPFYYVPITQQYNPVITLQLRAAASPEALAPEVTQLIHSLEPAMTVFDVQTMTAGLDGLNGFLVFEFAAGLAGALGFLGLTLAIVGVYGVVSHSAGQRTHEIGVRMALGAQTSQIVKMVVSQGFLIVGFGIVAGVLAAAALAKVVGNFLFGVAALDPLTYIGASLVLAAIALLACYIPARRAMRVDPMVALRYE